MGGGEEKGQTVSDPLAALRQQKEAERSRRLAEVRGEWQAYFEEQKKRQKQEEQVAEEQKKMEEIERKKSKKKQEEEEMQRRMTSQYGGTGETVKGVY